ncbi:hypothetical protein HZ326_9453 [Fusarium oxysporum f. sp. albedinis]|nr:hypothetical protein HZ326_9453 [Fusarium oxysporum f. sp. albedinis]
MCLKEHLTWLAAINPVLLCTVVKPNLPVIKILFEGASYTACMTEKITKSIHLSSRYEYKKNIDNGRIRTYACEHNAYDVSEEIAGHRLNHSATLSYLIGEVSACNKPL